MAAKRRGRRGFGMIRRLPSGRYQASYVGPDTARHKAPVTFQAEIDASGWLAAEHRLITDGTWTAPTTRAQRKAHLTVADYAESFMRRRDLRPTTRAHYERILARFILPAFGHMPLSAVTPVMVAEWHHDLNRETGRTFRAHAYALLRTLYRAAIVEDVVTTTPCRIPAAGTVKRARKIRTATPAELETLTAAMPERLRAAVLLMSWCALRYGEATELRRRDVDLKNGVIHVRRGVVRADGRLLVGDPKTEAAKRDVNVPPHLIPALQDHLAAHTAWGRDGLLFPAADGGNLAHSSFLWHFRKAAQAAGRPDLTPHQLRHTGAVLAAQSGATLAELMARLGHTTPAAAMVYQHAAADADKALAARMSAIASGHSPG